MEYVVRRSGTDPSAHLGQEEPAARHGTAAGFARARAHIQHVVRDARGGRPGVAAVHGLAGSGKTSLLDDALSHAGEFTRVTLPVPAGAVPLELWQRLFELDAAGSTAADELRQAARTAIRASAEVRDAPVLIVFDECPASHASAAQAIAAAVLDPELEVVAAFVVAWRDALDGSTSPLQFELPSHRLEPFTEAQSAELLKTRMGKSPDPAVLADLWRTTAGNPAGMLFASSRLSEDELAGLVPLPAPIPLGLELAEGFGGWTEELDQDARLAVAVASAAEMPRAVLEEALSQVDLTLDALRPARSLGVLSIGADRVRFIHPLCRAAAFQLATHDAQRAARHAATDALVGAGMVEEGAVLAATSAPARDERLTSLCLRASQAGSQRSDLESAARFLVLASRFAPTNEQAARHLIDASSLWQAAGRPDRARVCLQRVAPDNVSAAIIGHATYRSARSAFSLHASAHSLAEMAAGAEVCGATDPETASIMLADAAASAVLIDDFVAAQSYAQRAVELAQNRPGARGWALFARDAVSTILSGPGTLEKNAMQDSMDELAGSGAGAGFPGSPQLAYVLGSALVHVVTPALMGRWLAWIDEGVQASGDPSLAAAVALVRSRARLYAGDVPQAVSAADFAVTQLNQVQDVTLLARALGWSAWVHACAGQTTRALESATRFFALEQTALHLPHVQVLSSLAHCELQKGRVRGAHAWLQALEDECDHRSGHQDCFDWPSLQVFLQLALLSHYELGADVPVPPGTEHLSPAVADWNEDTGSSATLGGRETATASEVPSPFVSAHLKLVAAIRQRQLGIPELALFNFSRAETEFDECGAVGWSRLAAAQLGPARYEPTGGIPAPAVQRVVESRPDPTPAAESPERWTRRASEPLPSVELRLLGDFSVSYEGEPAVIPLGHAAQALKIIALFRHISVDELAELLWPGAEPGVGIRRLRNIHWRIKSACGDIVARSDNLICLEDWVVTDVGAFEEAAAAAFEGALPAEVASALARDALAKYSGELLPSDRHAEWTAGPRATLMGTRLQLLDLLYSLALSSGSRQDALSLLEELISANPSEERYYLQLATLHLEAGNRSRMRAAVSRGERMLADLGVEPSQGFMDFVSSVRDQ
jgi:DNA-binding SARP family transcriptional activator